MPIKGKTIHFTQQSCEAQPRSSAPHSMLSLSYLSLCVAYRWQPSISVKQVSNLPLQIGPVIVGLEDTACSEVSLSVGSLLFSLQHRSMLTERSRMCCRFCWESESFS